MTEPLAAETGFKLLGALYAYPDHGPRVIAELPDASMMPRRDLASVYSAMIESGLGSGRIDYSRVDVAANGVVEVTDLGKFTRGGKVDAELISLWAAELLDYHVKKSIADDLGKFIKALPNSDIKSDDAIAEIIERVKSHVGEKIGIEHVSVGVERAKQRIEQWRRGEQGDILLTGWSSIDDAIGGWEYAELVVLAGMTSGFKTASIVDMTKRMSLRFVKSGEPRAIVGFSAEMKHEKVVRRLASNLSGVPPRRLRPNRFGHVAASEEEIQAYLKALDEVSTWPVFIDETPDPSFEHMYSRCLQVQSQYDIACVWFDYLEKMGVNAPSEELRVSRIAVSLKNLAKMINRPVIALCQYSYQAEASEGGYPDNRWLRYSGKIAHEAATIIHWHYPKYFIDRKKEPSGVKLWDPGDPFAIYGLCSKGRDSGLANVRLYVNEETGRFDDPKDRVVPEPF